MKQNYLQPIINVKSSLQTFNIIVTSPGDSSTTLDGQESGNKKEDGGNDGSGIKGFYNRFNDDCDWN